MIILYTCWWKRGRRL